MAVNGNPMFDEEGVEFREAGAGCEIPPGALGVDVGRIVQCDGSGRVLVDCGDSMPKSARVVADLTDEQLTAAAETGREVLLAYQSGDPERPIVIALLRPQDAPARQDEAVHLPRHQASVRNVEPLVLEEIPLPVVSRDRVRADGDHVVEPPAGPGVVFRQDVFTQDAAALAHAQVRGGLHQVAVLESRLAPQRQSRRESRHRWLCLWTIQVAGM